MWEVLSIYRMYVYMYVHCTHAVYAAVHCTCTCTVSYMYVCVHVLAGQVHIPTCVYMFTLICTHTHESP